MASSALSCSRALLLILLVAVTLAPGSTEQRVSLTTTVIKCYPPPAPTNATNSTVFSANVLSLLAALPSAAAHTGFASLRSGGAFFVRGLCFGDATPPECRRCLSVAAKELTSGCGADSDGCFASYADTNATAPTDDAARPRVISGPVARNASGPDLERLAAVAQFLAPLAAASDKMLAVADAPAVARNYAARSTVRVLAQCARDLPTAAACARCIEYSARVAAACCWELDPWRDGVAAAVVAFDCYLRFEVSTAPVPLRERIGMVVNDYPALTGLLAVVVVALFVGAVVGLIQKICTCWMERKIRAVNNARNAAVPAAVAVAPQAPVELVHVDRAQAALDLDRWRSEQGRGMHGAR